ncbi:Uncharacterised protein [uncultured archaeon]|nr:Uncharacterised protein [uncultured archaeon]
MLTKTIGNQKIEPEKICSIDHGAKFTAPAALKRIKEGAPFLPYGSIALIMSNSGLYHKLPGDIRRELEETGVQTCTFISKSDKPLGEKLVYSYKGFSVTEIIPKVFEGSSYDLASDLTPDNFEVTFKNRGQDAIVERLEDSIVPLNLVKPGAMIGWGSFGRANASTLYLPVNDLHDDGSNVIELRNCLDDGDMVVLAAAFAGGTLGRHRYSVSATDPAFALAGLRLQDGYQNQ